MKIHIGTLSTDHVFVDGEEVSAEEAASALRARGVDVRKVTHGKADRGSKGGGKRK